MGKIKKLAEQANAEAAKIRRNVRVVEATRKEIQEINMLSTTTAASLLGMLSKCRTSPTDYTLLSPGEKQRLGALVNNTNAGAELLNRVAGADE
ncbi:hypothetical protein ACWGXJ_26520 [Paenibacillus sp. S33]